MFWQLTGLDACTYSSFGTFGALREFGVPSLFSLGTVNRLRFIGGAGGLLISVSMDAYMITCKDTVNRG